VAISGFAGGLQSIRSRRILPKRTEAYTFAHVAYTETSDEFEMAQALALERIKAFLGSD
jgi:hypothetical protein